MKAGLPLGLVIVLVGCGDNYDGSDYPAFAANNATSATNAALAAPEGPAAPECPPPQTAPGLDIVGIRIGMRADEAFRRVVCTVPDLQVGYRAYSGNPYGRAARPGSASARDFIESRISNGVAPDAFRVELAGLPGSEEVVAVHRELHFTPGSEPTIATLAAELGRKYGLVNGLPAEQRLQYGFYAASLIDGEGRLTAGVIEYRCTSRDSPTPRIDCPYFIAAEVRPRPDNPELAREMRIEIRSGPHAARMAAAYEAAATAAVERQRAQERAAAAGRPAPPL